MPRAARVLASTLGLALLIGAGAAAATLSSPLLGADLESIVRRLAQSVRENYVFPDKGEQAATMLESNLERGEYAGLDNARLAERLSRDLRELTGDRHFGVRPAPTRSQDDALVRSFTPRPSGTMGFERIIEGGAPQYVTCQVSRKSIRWKRPSR